MIDGKPRFVYPSERIHSLSGKAALCMGPLVYCFEGADNGDIIAASYVDTGSEVKPASPDPRLPKDALRLAVGGYVRAGQESLYSTAAPRLEPRELYAIPYCLWGNRAENAMRVWMDAARL